MRDTELCSLPFPSPSPHGWDLGRPTMPMPAAPVFFLIYTFVILLLGEKSLLPSSGAPESRGHGERPGGCVALCPGHEPRPLRGPHRLAPPPRAARLTLQPCGTPTPPLPPPGPLLASGLCLSSPSLTPFQPQGPPGCFADTPGRVLPRAFVLTEMFSPH